MYGYEIMIKNNTENDILLKEVVSDDFMTLKDIAKWSIVPTASDFIPIYGIITGAKTDLEKNRFTKPFPKNYVIKTDDSVRLLGLARIKVIPKMDFIFEINEKESIIQLEVH